MSVWDWCRSGHMYWVAPSDVGLIVRSSWLRCQLPGARECEVAQSLVQKGVGRLH